MPSLASILDKIFTGGQVTQTLQAGKAFSQLPVEEQKQLLNLGEKNAPAVYKYLAPTETSLRAPTELERVREPAVSAEQLGLAQPKGVIPESARQFLRGTAVGSLVERLDEKERRTLVEKLARQATVKRLTNKPLTEAESFAEQQEAKKVIAGMIPAEGAPIKGANFLAKVSKIKTGLLPKLLGKARLDTKKIKVFEDLIKRGEGLAPIPVTKVEGGYKLNKEGFYRLQAYKNLGLKEIPAVLEEKEAISASAKQLEQFKSPLGKERGFVTSVKEKLPELKVSGQYIPRSTDELAMKARNLVKENLATAEKVAQGTDDKAVATTIELLKHYNEQAAAATNQIVKDALYQRAAAIANDKARQLTELGRSVQAASILGRLTPEGQLKFAAREIQKYNEQVAKTRGGLFALQKKIPELTGEQVASITQEMKGIQAMEEGTEKAMRFQKLQNYINDLVPTPLMKKLTTIWKAGLLTGVKTSGLNIFSNLSHAGTEVVKDIPASMIDQIVSLFTGKRTVTPTLRGILSGGKEGLQKGIQYFKTGFDERNIGAKLDYTRTNMDKLFGSKTFGDAMQKYTDTVFRVLGSEDQPFYYAAKLRSLEGQAKAAAINKGLMGKQAQVFIENLVQSPTDEMIKYAALDAETAVFQNKTALGEAASTIQRRLGTVGQVVMPFTKTPSAVAMQVVNYSPAGAVKTIVENIGKGRFDQRLFSQGIGRALTGTAALYIGAELAKKELITGARPTTEREQKLWELEGKQPNSIKIDGKWRQIQVLGPAGNVLLIGSLFQNELDKGGSPTEAITRTLAGASQAFSQQTFLTGVSNFIDAVSDPARSAEYVAGSTLASTIPTIISDIARATDTKERRANEILEKFQARIPGLREKLEPQVTTLGEEKETVGNPLEIMADPTRPSPVKSSPLIQELRRLWDAGYKVSPTLLGDKKGYRALTPEQNTKLWKKAGEIINQKVSNLIKTEAYQSLADDEKARHIDNFVAKSKISARLGMVIELTQGLQGEELKAKLSKLKESGLMTRDIFNQYLKLH